MKRVFLAAILVFLSAGLLAAQDFPKVEIFGGYSLLRAGGSDLDSLFDEVTLDAPAGVKTSRLFKKGFEASVTYNLNSYFGIEGAFQYNTHNIMELNADVPQYPGSTNIYAYDASIGMDNFTVMAGPKLAYRQHEKMTPFVHFLVGMDRLKMTPSLIIDGEDQTAAFTNETGIGEVSDTGLGMMFGGGVDVNINDMIAVRPIQVDYLMGKHDDFTMHGMKLSFGVVFRLGGK